MTSETVHCKRGVNQLFTLTSHTFCPAQYTDEELTYSPDRDGFPIAIHCVVDEGGDGEYWNIRFFVFHHIWTRCLSSQNPSNLIQPSAWSTIIWMAPMDCEHWSRKYLWTVFAICCKRSMASKTKILIRYVPECYMIDFLANMYALSNHSVQHRGGKRRQFEWMCDLHERHTWHTDFAMSPFMLVQFVCGFIALPSEQLSNLSCTIPCFVTNTCGAKVCQRWAKHQFATIVARRQSRQYTARLHSSIADRSIEWTVASDTIPQTRFGH